MFRVEFMVRDNKLAQVLNGLGDRVENLSVQPVRNIIENEDGTSTVEERMTMDEVVLKHIRDNNLRTIESKVMKKILMARGSAPNSHGYAVRKLVEQKIIKSHKDVRGLYDVIG